MIIKQVAMKSGNSGSFKGLVDYLTNDKNNISRVGEITLSNLKADSINSALIEIKATQLQNTRAKSDKTLHLIISFPEGERPSKEVLLNIENDVCKKLGLSAHQRISVVHDDTDNLHIHLAINKINPKSKRLIEPFQSFRKLTAAAKECELKYNLTIDNHEQTQSHSESNIQNFEIQKGEESLCAKIRKIKDQLNSAKDWSEFKELLANNGCEIKVKANGFIFVSENIHVKASTVDRNFSKKKLEEKFGIFITAIDKEAEEVKQSNEIKEPAKSFNKLEQKLLWIEYQNLRMDSSEFNKKVRSDALTEYRKECKDNLSKLRLERKILKFLHVPHWMNAYFKLCLYLRAKQMRAEAKRKLKNNLYNASQVKQSWLVFLKEKAQNGNATAQEILVNRRSETNKKNDNKNVIRKNNANAIHFYNVVSFLEKKKKRKFVTSKGTKIYILDNSCWAKVSQNEITFQLKAKKKTEDKEKNNINFLKMLEDKNITLNSLEIPKINVKKEYKKLNYEMELKKNRGAMWAKIKAGKQITNNQRVKTQNRGKKR